MAGVLRRRWRRAGTIAVGMVVASWLGLAPARAQFFSPGALAKPHAALEGLDNCLRCHNESRGLSPSGCLGCHNELAPSIKAATGLHGRMTAEKRTACESCHPDHRGRDFALLDWAGGRSRFDHAQTGWRLEGVHARTDCEQCHQRGLIAVPSVLQALRATPKRNTYLGLSPRCASCHFDEHRGQVGTNCQSCHTAARWKPAPGFEHTRTAFPLRGKHATVACAKCHPTLNDEDAESAGVLKPASAQFMEMKPIDHQTCASCHADPHDGKLGPACANCHSETSWRSVVVKRDAEPSFHENTRFPLRGGHIGVACRSCHGPFPGQRARYQNLPFSRCSDCHQDAHVGQLAAAGRKPAGDCERCHDVNGFAPARFELEQHANTAFPLEGAHAATACRDCHALDDRLAARVPAAVRRLLRGAHRPLEISLAVLRPRERPDDCAGCHADPHGGQFLQGAQRKDCRACHGTDSFHALKFEHSRQSRFPLEGAHVTVACRSCHRPERLQANAPATIRYKGLPVTCAGCHADEHQGQFDGARATDCASCHRSTTFTETLFSHGEARFTPFALRGKHASLTCDRCHPSVEVASKVSTVWYRGVPTACAGCHVDFHRGDFRGLAP